MQRWQNTTSLSAGADFNPPEPNQNLSPFQVNNQGSNASSKSFQLMQQQQQQPGSSSGSGSYVPPNAFNVSLIDISLVSIWYN